MNQPILKYASLIAVLIIGFGNFVACGSQLYQMSLEEDYVMENPPEGVEDPNSPNYGLHSPDGWRELPVRFRTGTNLTPDQHQGLLAAMATWETAVGKQLFQYLGPHQSVTGDSFDALYDSLEDGVNGHYLDGDWAKTKKRPQVLATTIWDNIGAAIANSDIRFNGEYYIIGDAFQQVSDGEREVVDMWTLAIHELGHLLGLAHVSETVDPDSIMLPSVFIGENLSNRLLSEGDIKRVQTIYGCEGAACDLQDAYALIQERAYAKNDSYGIRRIENPDAEEGQEELAQTEDDSDETSSDLSH